MIDYVRLLCDLWEWAVLLTTESVTNAATSLSQTSFLRSLLIVSIRFVISLTYVLDVISWPLSSVKLCLI